MPENTQDETVRERRAYNLRSAFKLLHISESYGHSLVRAGKIKTVRLGPASPRVTAEEIERLLREGIAT
jgi:predicted site-specific integrase-resolvase